MSLKFWVMLISIALFSLSYWFIPKPALLESIHFSSVVYDKHGKLLRFTLSEDEKYRLFSPISEISPLVIEATLLYEDKYFFSHPGVNPVALLRAAWDTYIIKRRAVGASTISMQLARILFQIDSRNIWGKLEQICRSIQFERHYSKSQILEAYLNLAPYGRNIEGIGAASLIYFAKPAEELSLPEALALSVVPQNPSARLPSRHSGYHKMLQARERLFELWVEAHPEDAEMKAMMDLSLLVSDIEDLPFFAPHFVNKQLSKIRLGESRNIKSTLDLNLQNHIERLASTYIAKKRAFGFNNASVMLLDYKSMEVVASVGSVNFFDNNIQGQVDGTHAKRSPGSTLKPFIYALAMDQSIIHPMTMLKDAPKRFGAYTPENFDRGFAGPIFAKDALIYSRNVPAVNLMAQLNKPSLYDFLKQSGITGLKAEAYYGLALALGGHELTMVELVKLYAMLVNRGKLQEIKTELSEQTEVSAIQLLSPEASFLTLDMLKANPRPKTSSLLSSMSKRPKAYWKTGTSFAYRDAWSVGISGPYVLAVWVGNFNGEGNPSFVGRKAAAPLFFEIIDALASNDKRFSAHPLDDSGLDITKVDVCAPTGDLPGRYCPKTVKSWFIPSKSPIRVSNVYRAIAINKTTGLRACNNDSDDVEMKVFEFWPSNIVKIFRSAGISRQLPPNFEKECTIDMKATQGVQPLMQSPDSTVIYAMRSERINEERIPFMAIADTDVKKLFWFVDDSYVGFSTNGEPFYWKPALIHASVRVVDDHGRAVEGEITVELVQ